MKIHYIAEYSGTNNNYVRKGSPAGFAKMSYFENVFNSIGVDYEIYSTSQAVSPPKQKKRREGRIVYRSSFLTKNKYMFLFERFWAILQLLIYLIKIPKNDIVFVYHERYYAPWIKVVHRLKRWKLIYEVEEIYGDVAGNLKMAASEHKYLSIADAYIFPTILLNQDVNTKGKPYLINHGTYEVAKEFPNDTSDDKIHCVYAGTFDQTKGGVTAAVAAAEFLDERYVLHVLGFGSEREKEQLLRFIEEVSKRTQCKITYDGLLKGEEYFKYIQSCNIGLSTQNPLGGFNETSFPSKVLSYMANGLRVVSARIKVLETSELNELLYYYDESTPQNIAATIRLINIDDKYDSKKKILELDKDFKANFKRLIENLKGEK